MKKLVDRILVAPYWTVQQQPPQDNIEQPVEVQLNEQVQNEIQQVDQQIENHDQTAAMLNKLNLHSQEEQLQYQQHVVLEQGRSKVSNLFSEGS